MSLYDKASVALIPSGTKASKLYSVLPANGDGDFTHTRGSTATRVNKDGLIESVAANVPRLDYPLTSGVVGDCPHLLLEPSRTNIITNSEQFVDAPTGNTNMDLFSGTITNNNTTSPDGNTKGMKYTISSGSGATLRIYQSDLSTSADTTFTIYAKKGTTDSFSINIAGGTATSVTLTDEWQRITTTDTSNSNKFIDVTVTGSVGQYIYIFGMQAEAASYATSYIPTSGSAVTRSADACNSAGTSAEFNDSEGVLFAEIAALANDGTTRRLAVSDGSTSNRLVIGYLSTSNQFQLLVNSTNSAFTFHSVTSVLDFHKVAIKYKQNDIAFWVDGVEVDTDTSADTPSGLIELAFDDGAGGNDFYGKCKQIIVFNEALSDSELATLTS